MKEELYNGTGLDAAEETDAKKVEDLIEKSKKSGLSEEDLTRLLKK